MKRKLLSMLSVASFFLMNAQNTDYNKDFKFLEYDIEKLQKGYQNKEYKISEVVKSYLERIEKVDKNGAKLNAVITVNPDAMKIADSLDQVPMQLRKGALFGVLLSPMFAAAAMSFSSVSVIANSLRLNKVKLKI